MPGKVVEAPGVDDVISLSGGDAAAAAEQTLWRSDFFTQCMATKLAMFKVRRVGPEQQLTLVLTLPDRSDGHACSIRTGVCI